MTDLFDQDDQDNTDYLAELTKPGAKFDKTKYASETEMYQAIAKGKFHSDKTLDQRNQEFDQLREFSMETQAKVNAQAKYDELLAKLEATVNRDATNTPVGNVEQPFDPNKLDELLEQKLTKREQDREEKANLDKVNQRLTERFGDNAGSVLQDKMNALKLSKDDIKLLAKKSPEAVFNALGLNQQQPDFQAPPRSSMRSDNLQRDPGIRDAVFYEKMRKEDPKKYFSQQMSTQRLKDMDSPEFLKRYRELERST